MSRTSRLASSAPELFIDHALRFEGFGELLEVGLSPCGVALQPQPPLFDADGILRVVKASPEGYELVAEADVFAFDDDRDQKAWAPMALAGKRLLMRSQEELICVEL